MFVHVFRWNTAHLPIIIELWNRHRESFLCCCCCCTYTVVVGRETVIVRLPPIAQYELCCGESFLRVGFKLGWWWCRPFNAQHSVLELVMESLRRAPLSNRLYRNHRHFVLITPKTTGRSRRPEGDDDGATGMRLMIGVYLLKCTRKPTSYSCGMWKAHAINASK